MNKSVNGVSRAMTTEEEKHHAQLEALYLSERPAQLMNSIRVQRNHLLAETDWTANSDVTMSPEMATYRQSLRDLPSTVDINNPVFPTKPTGG